MATMWVALSRGRIEVPESAVIEALAERNELVDSYWRFPNVEWKRLCDRGFNTWLSEIENSLDPDSPTFVREATLRKIIVIGTIASLAEMEAQLAL